MRNPDGHPFPQPAYFLDLVQSDEAQFFPLTPDPGHYSRLNSYLYGLEEIAAGTNLPQDQVEEALVRTTLMNGYSALIEGPIWVTRVIVDVNPERARQTLLEDMLTIQFADLVSA